MQCSNLDAHLEMKTTGESPAQAQRFAEILRERRDELSQRYGVKTLGIFGSYARGEQRRHSDLDVLVEFDDRVITLFHIVNLEEELSRLLGVKVDLVERQALKPSIRRHVLQEVIPVL